MPFTKPLPEWDAAGVEPPASTKQNGYQAGDKPPADWFNWFFNLVYQALQELQQNLSNVDNTSDANKPVSTAQAEANTTIYNNILTWVKSFGLGSSISDWNGKDANSINATGFYGGSNITNAPNTTDVFYIIHLHGSYPKQIAISNGNASYYRVYNAGAWSSWKTVATTDGNIATASKLQTSRTISLTGDATGSASFDGSTNVSISAVLTAANVLSKLLTVDGSGSGLDADKLDGKDSSEFLSALGNAVSASKLSTPRTITAAGGATGSMSFDGTTNVILNLSLVAAQVLASLLTVDGSGSGLDSDTVDGKHFADIQSDAQAKVDTLEAITQNIKITTDTGAWFLNIGSSDDVHTKLQSLPNGLHTVYIASGATNSPSSSDYLKGWCLNENSTHLYAFFLTDTGNSYSITYNGASWVSQKVNDSASDILTKLKTVDGSGSGVDADLLDGHDSSYFLPTTGNAPTASKLQTARTISLTGDVTGSIPFDGSGNVNLAATLTAASVLAKLLIVDGSGSGLDGDTVDGKHYSDIQSDAQAKVDTLKAITQNYKLTNDNGNNLSTADADMNNNIVPGFYTVSATTNTPAGSRWYYLIVQRHQDTTHKWVDQWAIVMTADPPDIYHRICNSDIWTAWTKINQSASDILSKLLTVDGSGSSLDADLLDGHDSSYFLPATGNAPTASKLQTARTLSISGDGVASGSFDGSANLALALVLASSGVTAGTYKSVTVDSKGRVTGGTNPTTLAGYGITDAVSESEVTNWQKQKLTDDSGFATSQTDLNSITGTKTIALNTSVSNRPFDYGTVLQVSNDDLTKTQVAIDNYSGATATRSYNSSGGWSAWATKANQSDLNTTNTNVANKADKTTDFVKSFGTNGYQKLPSGLIVQWGTASISNTSTYIAFPAGFPNASLAIFATPNGWDSGSPIVVDHSQTAMHLQNNVTSTVSVFWLVIGY